MSSVREIADEVNRMLNVADGLERVDIFNAINRVVESRDEMQKEFNKEDYDEVRVSVKKKKCEKEAIRLEYLLTKFDIQLKRRYESRIWIAGMYTLLNNIIMDERKSGFGNRERLLQALCSNSQVERLSVESQSILFSLSGDDKELLELIQSQTEEYGRVSNG